MNQLSKATDRKLNELSRALGVAESLIETGTKTKDEAWVQVVDAFAEFDPENKRFIASDGHSLDYQMRQGAPKMDTDKLKELIFSRYAPVKAKRIWKSITQEVVTVNNTLLEAAVLSGKVDGNLVQECITVPNPTFARVRREWTHDDKEKAALFGIVKEG